MKLLLTCFLLIGLAPIIPIVHGATYYVSTGGSDSNVCTDGGQATSQAKRSINGGASCLSGGDTLIVKDGTYTECMTDIIPSGSAAQHTTVKAENKRQAILDPPSNCGGGAAVLLGCCNGSVNTAKSYITIQGLYVRINPNYVLGAFGAQGGSNTDITNGPHDLWFLDLEASGCMDTGSISNFCNMTGQGGNGHDFIWRGNYFHDVGLVRQPGTINVDGLQGCTSYIWYVSGWNNLIENNIVARSCGFGIHGYSTSDHFYNNTIRNNYFHDIGGAAVFMCGNGGTNGGTASNYVYNNIFARVAMGYASTPLQDHGAFGGQSGGIMTGISCSGVQANYNQIYNNTLVYVNANSTNAGTLIGCIELGVGATASSANTVRNNICAYTSHVTEGVLNSSSTGPNTIDHNLCATSGTNCQFTGDPLFQVTIPNSDLDQAGITAASFQLQPTSPALGMGADVSAVLTTDFAGQTRPAPAGTSVDLGAWEMGGTGGGPTTSVGPFYMATPSQAGGPGNDSNSCDAAKSVSTPKATLASVVPCMAPGATLYIRSGTYTESFSSDTIHIPGGITGQAWAGATTITRYQADTTAPVFKPTFSSGQRHLKLNLSGQTYIVFDGITLDGGGTNGVKADSVVYITGAASSIRLQNMTFLSGALSTVWIEGSNNELLRSTVVADTTMNYGSVVLAGGATNTIIDGNDIRGYVGGGISDTNYTGAAGSNNIIRNNTIHDPGTGNTDAGIVVVRATSSLAYNNVNYRGYRCYKTAATTGAKFFNNTCYADTYGMYIDTDVSTVRIQNNILDSPSGGNAGIDDHSTSATKNHNVCPTSTTGCDVAGTLGFAGPTNGDFRLSASSVAVEAGTSLTEVPVDIQGVSRPQLANYDAGAYEYFPGPSTGTNPCSPANYKHLSNNSTTGMAADFCPYAYLPFRVRLPDNPQHIDATYTPIFQNEYATYSGNALGNPNGANYLFTQGLKPTKAGDGTSQQHTWYIASSTDPLVSIDCSPGKVNYGCSDLNGHSIMKPAGPGIPPFHIPAYARLNGERCYGCDVFTEIIQPDGTVVGIGGCNEYDSVTPNGSGQPRDWQTGDVITAPGDPGSFCTAYPYGGYWGRLTDPGANDGSINAGDAMTALPATYQEVTQLHEIRHALHVYAACFSPGLGRFPGTYAGECGPNHIPPYSGVPVGSHIWLDRTRAQIDAISAAQPLVIPPALKVFAYALHEHGAYMLDTGSPSGHKWITQFLIEGHENALYSGAITQSPWVSWMESIAGVGNVIGGSGSAVIGQVQGQYIDWSQLVPYLHVLDPCYALGTCSDSVPDPSTTLPPSTTDPLIVRTRPYAATGSLQVR